MVLIVGAPSWLDQGVMAPQWFPGSWAPCGAADWRMLFVLKVGVFEHSVSGRLWWSALLGVRGGPE